MPTRISCPARASRRKRSAPFSTGRPRTGTGSPERGPDRPGNALPHHRRPPAGRSLPIPSSRRRSAGMENHAHHRKSGKPFPDRRIPTAAASTVPENSGSRGADRGQRRDHRRRPRRRSAASFPRLWQVTGIIWGTGPPPCSSSSRNRLMHASHGPLKEMQSAAREMAPRPPAAPSPHRRRTRRTWRTR